MGFPLPYFLVFVGYALILMIDKVAFDSHSLHHHDHGHDQVEKNLLKAANKVIHPRHSVQMES